MIKVLIAEDSIVFQKVLVSFLKKERNIEIVGIVDNGFEAIEQCKRLKPDLITMDIFMPKMNGLEATRRIMAECPTRIVIISSMIDAKNLQYSLEAIQAGAVEVIAKPQDMITGNYDMVQDKLIKVLRQTMAAEPMKRFSWLVSRPWEVSTPEMVSPCIDAPLPDIEMDLPEEKSPNAIGKYRSSSGSAPAYDSRDDYDEKREYSPLVVKWRPQPISPSFVPLIVCIGGSTGAPAVISDILRCLPGNFAVPILIAQHIVKGFVKGMADWLDHTVELDVSLAVDGTRPLPGQVLLAPDETHLGLTKKGLIELLPKEGKELYVPSVNRLFSAAAKAFGPRALGIVLSGMGKDGADGLLELRKAGGVTIGQNAATSVVYGMPKVALAQGAVMDAMGPEGMVKLLLQLDERIKTIKRSD